MDRIYMIRHAKPASTWCQSSDLDTGLDEQGRVQAQAASRALMLLPEAVRPRFVVSSPLRRCIETARPFAQALGVELEIDARFGEIPTPAGLSPAERPPWLRRAFAGRWSEITGDIDYEAWRRAVAGALLGRAGAAVFSHYVAINAAVSCAAGRDEVLCFQPDHASVTVFTADADGLRLAEQGRQAETLIL